MKATLICLLISAFALCGCEREKPAPPAKQPTTVESEDIQDNRPKAPLQLSKTIQLLDYPLALRVPEKWEIKYGGVTLLQGPTPNGPLPDGTIHLIVSRQPPMPSSMAEAIKPATTKPATTPSFDREQLRTLGKLKIYERRLVQPPKAGLPEMMKWSISAYEPIDAKNVRVYQISFLDLTREHFEKDRNLLESIMESLSIPQESGPAIQ
jgi:hypothetical protein